MEEKAAAEGEEVAAPAQTDPEPEKEEFKFLLGKEHKKDSAGGDAGCIPKKSKYFPFVEFIRSEFYGKN